MISSDRHDFHMRKDRVEERVVVGILPSVNRYWMLGSREVSDVEDNVCITIVDMTWQLADWV